MSEGYEQEVLGRARMRQNHEEARRRRDIALAEQAAAKPRKSRAEAVLARVAWVLGIRRRILAGLHSPVHEEP